MLALICSTTCLKPNDVSAAELKLSKKVEKFIQFLFNCEVIRPNITRLSK